MWNNGVSQTPAKKINISGDWKCVRFSDRGIQKYTLEQAREIRKSILHIEDHTYYFKRIEFIDRCFFLGWKATPYSGIAEPVRSLEAIYTKRQLNDLILIDPVDKNGNVTCYNNCLIFKKGNKLITICGGYTFYWKKIQKLIRGKYKSNS
nr:hypothetical protein [Mucilaginibacter sp. L294]